MHIFDQRILLKIRPIQKVRGYAECDEGGDGFVIGRCGAERRSDLFDCIDHVCAYKKDE
jgi:hypothetical protein